MASKRRTKQNVEDTVFALLAAFDAAACDWWSRKPKSVGEGRKLDRYRDASAALEEFLVELIDEWAAQGAELRKLGEIVAAQLGYTKKDDRARGRGERRRG